MSFADAPRCTGHKRDGSPCTQVARQGKTKCRLHGGNSLSGPANGNYRTGRYSKVLPVRLAARAQEALTNPRLLSLADDIATAEARLSDLFLRVDTGESGAVWQALGLAFQAFRAAMQAKKLEEMQQHLETLERLIQHGHSDYEAWHEIHRVWEVRCKLTQTEQKTLLTMQQMITTEQLLMHMKVVTDAIRRTVLAYTEGDTARHILGDLTVEFNRLAVLESGGRVGPE